jgi:regulator of PEP synthase PpsR (kinase-PPPase family)
MMHDDGQHVEGLEDADTCAGRRVPYLERRPRSTSANRGIRTANVPLVPGHSMPHQLES